MSQEPSPAILDVGPDGATWQEGGYRGAGNVAGLLGSLRGRSAVIAGSGWDVFDEVHAASSQLGDPVVFAVNDVGMHLDGVEHWVSLHRNRIKGMWAVRACRDSQAECIQIHSFGQSQWRWDGLSVTFLLSGYFAMQIAWLMGCTLIVLAGCPGSEQRRFFEAAPRKDFAYGDGGSLSDSMVRRQLMAEMERIPAFKASVRSMSGWTQEYFGGL